MHPQTQGKIERYHRSMKKVIKLNHYFCPSELENAIDGWVKYYNERRFHESLDNLTPKDVYLGQGEKIKKIREIIRQNSTNKRIFDNKILEQITTFAVVHFCLTTYNQSGNKKRTVYKHIRVDCWTGTRKTS